jgi:hypothetical protein
MAAEDFLQAQLRKIRFQFLPDDPKAFFQQQKMIIKAICYPATYLQKRGVQLPERRLEQILNEVLRGIMHHGQTSKITWFGGYFLKCIQEHMSHHGDEYYDEGKDLRTILQKTLAELSKKEVADLPSAQDDTTARLADAAKLLKSTKPIRKNSAVKGGRKTGQLDLF